MASQLQVFDTFTINGYTRSDEYPIYPTRGGFITVDTPISQIFYQLRCGTSGNLIVLGKDNNYLYYPAVLAGETIVTCGRGVVSAATIDGQSVATTASDIWWFGGV